MKRTAAAPGQPQAPWYTYRWPWLLMLGPATVLVAGAVSTWLAVSRPDALVVGDYYKQGKAINQDLRRDRVASAMQLSLRARLDPASGRLEGRLTSGGRAVSAPFRILLAHPTLPEKDRTLLAMPGPDGRFSLALGALEHAHWQVVLEGARRDWRMARSWDWPWQATLEVDADADRDPAT
ncbi:MAG: FixH family protein [Massilia sp.]